MMRFRTGRAHLVQSAFVVAVLTQFFLQSADASGDGQESSVQSVQLADAQEEAAREIFAQAYNLYKQGLNWEALEKFRNGLKIDPNNQTAHYYVAVILNDSNTMADHDVLEHLVAAVRLQPESKYGVLANTMLVEKERAIKRHWQVLSGRWCLDHATTARVDRSLAHVYHVPELFELMFNDRFWVTGVSWISDGDSDEFDEVAYGDGNVILRYLVSRVGLDSWAYDFDLTTNIVGSPDPSHPLLELTVAGGSATAGNSLIYYDRCK